MLYPCSLYEMMYLKRFCWWFLVALLVFASFFFVFFYLGVGSEVSFRLRNNNFHCFLAIFAKRTSISQCSCLCEFFLYIGSYPVCIRCLVGIWIYIKRSCLAFEWVMIACRIFSSCYSDMCHMKKFYGVFPCLLSQHLEWERSFATEP